MAKVSERQMAAFKKLGYSDAQIEEMIEDDKAVDRNEPLPWDMSKEEHKKAMKYANADEHKKPTVYKFDKRERKANDDKRTLIEIISNAVNAVADEAVEVTNIEREMVFHYKGAKYKVVLSAPRS